MIARLLIGLKIEFALAALSRAIWRSNYIVLAILGRAKGDDHEAVRGPSRLGAYTVRLCVFAHRRSCRRRDRT